MSFSFNYPTSNPKTTQYSVDMGASLVQALQSVYEEPDVEYAIKDALADLMHYCRAHGRDFSEVLQSAHNSFRSECAAELCKTYGHTPEQLRELVQGEENG